MGTNNNGQNLFQYLLEEVLYLKEMDLLHLSEQLTYPFRLC